VKPTLACPSCGSPQPAHNPGLVSFVCEYCHGIFYRDEESVLAAGHRSLLTEGFSRLYRGAVGQFHQKRFRVLGRIRYGHPRGFWDEWFLEMEDGSEVWLSEDQHELCEQRQVDFDPTPSNPQREFENYLVGSTIAFRDRSFRVQEVGHAECLGLEGALPKKLELGETYPYVDATSLDGLYSLGLEFDDEKPTAFHGRWVRWNELQLDDEGLEW
jgi:hypothetical protein